MSGPVYDDPISGYRRPTTPAPVCTTCGSHINPDYGTGPICGACLKEPEVSPLKESLDDIAGSLVDTLMRKNTDYGDSYRRLRDEFGPDSFLIRLGDKYNRLIALRGKEALVSETTDDTIRDIAGYCLLEMVYRARGEAE